MSGRIMIPILEGVPHDMVIVAAQGANPQLVTLCSRKKES